MRLNRIEIQGFRCFEHFKCQFSSGVNVLIGRNGAGKTTLVHAIHKALSFIFSNDRSLGKEFLSQGNNTLNVRGFKEEDYRFDFKTREAVKDAIINAEATYGSVDLDWKLYRRNQTNAALYQRYYKEAFASFMNEWKVNGKPLPLLAYYSDSYPHINANIVKKVLDKVNNGVLPRNFGYYQWDDEAACTSIWEIRICNCINRVQPYYTLMSRAISENDEKEVERISGITAAPMAEIEFVENRLKDFASRLPGIKEQGREIDYFSAAQTNSGYRMRLHFKDGSDALLENFPAGYRRLYSIVFDMAYRAYVLNQDVEPEGIVIIDEIDLHLHPELEKDVMNVLHKTFPKVQFIVSTHSAMVISNLEGSNGDSRIMRMEENKQPTVIGDIYGLDYNSSVEDIMGVDARNAEIDNLLNTLAFFEQGGMAEQARNVRALLLEKLNGDVSNLDKLLAERRKDMGNELRR